MIIVTIKLVVILGHLNNIFVMTSRLFTRGREST